MLALKLISLISSHFNLWGFGVLGFWGFGVLFFSQCRTYSGDNELGEFLDEVRTVFKNGIDEEVARAEAAAENGTAARKRTA